MADTCGGWQVTKTVADKILKEMENNGQIMGKSTKGKDKDGKDIAGSQWVFWCVQVCILGLSSSRYDCD